MDKLNWEILAEHGVTPDNLSVAGDLNLYGVQITELPDNLNVAGSLYLNYTQITELPDNLNVVGGLYLNNTQITELPDNLNVVGEIHPHHYRQLISDSPKTKPTQLKPIAMETAASMFLLRIKGAVAAMVMQGGHEPSTAALDLLGADDITMRELAEFAHDMGYDLQLALDPKEGE